MKWMWMEGILITSGVPESQESARVGGGWGLTLTAVIDWCVGRHAMEAGMCVCGCALPLVPLMAIYDRVSTLKLLTFSWKGMLHCEWIKPLPIHFYKFKLVLASLNVLHQIVGGQQFLSPAEHSLGDLKFGSVHLAGCFVSLIKVHKLLWSFQTFTGMFST